MKIIEANEQLLDLLEEARELALHIKAELNLPIDDPDQIGRVANQVKLRIAFHKKLATADKVPKAAAKTPDEAAKEGEQK